MANADSGVADTPNTNPGASSGCPYATAVAKLGPKLSNAIKEQAQGCNPTPTDEEVQSAIKIFGNENGFSYKKNINYATSIVGQNESTGAVEISGGEGGTGKTTSLCAAIGGLEGGTLISNDENRKPDMDSKPTRFHERTVGEVDQARKEFDGTDGKRAQYLKAKAQELKDAKAVGKSTEPFTDADVKVMSKGKVPEGYNVHHKTPIFRSPPNPPGADPNSSDNLEILPDKFHKDYNKELHWYVNGENAYSNGKGPAIGNLKI